MALTTLTALKTFLRITDTSQDTLLTQLLAVADRCVKLFCKRDLELTVYTEYRDGNGALDLALRQRPARFFTLTGTTTSASAVVTGISSTTNLTAGMPATGTGIPDSAVISTVDSASQVTLSAAATASGTVSIVWGLAVWLDPGGVYGQATGAFPSTSRLVLGSDFALPPDQADGSSKAAVLRRMGGGSVGGPLAWPWAYPVRRGTLTAGRGPAWPKAAGVLKVVYAAGYPSGSIPAELAYAVHALTAVIRALTPVGVPVQLDAVVPQVMDILAAPRGGEAPELATVRSILRSYREPAL